MTVAQVNNPTGTPAEQTPAPGGLSAGLLDALAARLRGSGLFLALLDRDGEPTYHDAAAPALFTKFLWPQLRSSVPNRKALVFGGSEPTGASPVRVSPDFPGFVVATVPQVDKRQVVGALLLAGKAEDFRLDEGVLREAGRYGLDATWLSQQADRVAPSGEPTVLSMAAMLPALVRDQLRLGAFEQEIHSLSTQLANSYEELSLIYQVSGGMKVNRGPGEFFRQACADCREVVAARGMGFALSGEGIARPEPALLGETDVPPAMVGRLTDELIAALRERKSTLLVGDVAADKRFGWLAGHAKQILAVPLQRQDKVLGCLFAVDKEGGEFDSVDIKLLNSIANESAIYLENAMLFEDVRSLMMGVLHSLTSAVDAKDAYTCGHSERVALISRRLSQELGLPAPLVERVYMAGILHDVGKIGVPEAVLHKTGKLTNEEFEQMKRHPQIGARILSDIKQVEDLIPGVLHHHERYDGRGYPARLSGEGIPQMGRIICIADCFDAMTSNRTYRRALPLEVALIEVRRCAGTEFDPTMAEAFLRITPDQFRTLLGEHQSRAALTAPAPELAKRAA